MDPKKINELKVGLFVSFGLIIIIISIFLLGGDKIIFTPYYDLRAQFNDVQGLNSGSIVSLSGITVGNIHKIDFTPKKNGLLVTMKINENFKNRITKGSTAEIKTQGALGDKIIYIRPGPLGSPPLHKGEVLQPLEGTDFMSVLTSNGDQFQKVFEIIDEINILVKKINSNDYIMQILKSTSESSQKLNLTLTSAQSLIIEIQKLLPKNNKVSESIDHFNNILTKIDKGEGTLGGLINDPTIHHQLKTLLGGNSREKYFKGALQKTIQKGSSADE